MEERVRCLKGYPDRKLSPANSAIKMSTGTAVFFLIRRVVLFYVMISKGQSRAGWPLHNERTGKEEVATGENRSSHGRSCIFQNPSLGLLQRIFRKLLHYEKLLKGIRNNNFSLNKLVKREI